MESESFLADGGVGTGAALAHPLAKRYRDAVFDAISENVWGALVAAVTADALAGDQRAREWVQRLLGVAQAVRVDAALRGGSHAITHSELLTAVERGRAHLAAGGGAQPLVCAGALVTKTTDVPEGLGSYWALVLQIVTPGVWESVVVGAVQDALAGDSRARDWVMRLLGTEGVIEAACAFEDGTSVVTLATLVEEIRAARGREMPETD